MLLYDAWPVVPDVFLSYERIVWNSEVLHNLHSSTIFDCANAPVTQAAERSINQSTLAQHA